MHLSCALHSSAAAPPLQNDPSIYPSIYREPPQLGFSTNPEQYRMGKELDIHPSSLSYLDVPTKVVVVVGQDGMKWIGE